MARIDAAGSTRRGPHAAGLTLRLALRTDSGAAWPHGGGSIAWRAAGGEVILRVTVGEQDDSA